MSNFITFEVKGLKEMGDMLAQLPGKIARRAQSHHVLQRRQQPRRLDEHHPEP